MSDKDYIIGLAKAVAELQERSEDRDVLYGYWTEECAKRRELETRLRDKSGEYDALKEEHDILVDAYLEATELISKAGLEFNPPILVTDYQGRKKVGINER